MKNYIIKNCPALSYGKGLRFKKCYHTNWKEYCKDCNNCVIKRIVQLCKIYKNMNAITTEDYARREVALKILDLLKMGEVDE